MQKVIFIEFVEDYKHNEIYVTYYAVGFKKDNELYLNHQTLNSYSTVCEACGYGFFEKCNCKEQEEFITVSGKKYYKQYQKKKYFEENFARIPNTNVFIETEYIKDQEVVDELVEFASNLVRSGLQCC